MVSGLWDPGSRVSQGHQIHHITRVTWSPGLPRVVYFTHLSHPWSQGYQTTITSHQPPAINQPITRVTGSPNHQGHRSPDHPDTRVTRVTKHQGHPHPGHQGHSGHPGHRVTRPTITQTPGSPYTQITHHHHHHQGHGSSPGSSPWIGSSH